MHLYLAHLCQLVTCTVYDTTANLIACVGWSRPPIYSLLNNHCCSSNLAASRAGGLRSGTKRLSSNTPSCPHAAISSSPRLSRTVHTRPACAHPTRPACTPDPPVHTRPACAHPTRLCAPDPPAHPTCLHNRVLMSLSKGRCKAAPYIRHRCVL